MSRVVSWASILLSFGFVLYVTGCNGGAGTALKGSDDTPDGPPAFFEDVTPGSGIAFTQHNGEEAALYSMLETLGGGVALIDYDGDGLLDVFLPGGGYFDGPDKKQVKGYPCKLYKNLGGFKFKDVTAEVGLDKLAGGQPWFYTHGCAVADYDRDGWPDLLVTGWGRVALFRNVSDGQGGRKFVEVTQEVGLDKLAGTWTNTAAFGDLDSDGYPDLYLCQYVDWSPDHNIPCPGFTTDVPRDVCAPMKYNGMPHILLHNVAGKDGKGRRFVEVTKEAGLPHAGQPVKSFGRGLGALFVDVNGDGKPDIYVCNDTTDNFLFLNQSSPGQLRFKEVGLDVGAARDFNGTPNGSMGVDAADYDGQGLPSIFVTNYEGELHALYRNRLRDGRLFFQYVTQGTGIGALGLLNVGFGTAFLDVDNDGWEDLVISHGHVIRHPARSPLRQKATLLLNTGAGRFRDITPEAGPYFRDPHRGRGLAVGDLDNAGRADLVITHVNEPVAVLRNVAGAGRHWLGVELAGTEHRDCTGARLKLEVGGRTLTRFAKAGGSYLSAGDRRQLFGLGPAEQIGRLTVEWPSGEPRVQHWEGLAVNRYWRLVQGEKTAQPVEKAR